MVLFAKIHSYALNAYLDAQIADEIITYVNSKGKSFATKKTVSQQRAEKLVNTKKYKANNDPSYLIGLAYTQYYLNGLADILYTDLLWPLMIEMDKSQKRKLYNDSISRFRKQFSTTYQYEEIIRKPAISVWYWPLVVSDPWRWADQFAKERCGYTKKLNRDALRGASLEVQRQNIMNNHNIAQTIMKNAKSTDPKVIEFRRLAKDLSNKLDFLQEAAATQEAAAKWDRIFTWLINH